MFGAEQVFGDDVSSVLQFDGAMINLLQADRAPELVTPTGAWARRGRGRG